MCCAPSVDRPNASFLDDHRRNSLGTQLAVVRGSTHGREAIRRAALITLRRTICEALSTRSGATEVAEMAHNEHANRQGDEEVNPCNCPPSNCEPWSLRR